MVEWLTVILVLAPVVAALYYLDRRHAPKWQIWAVWIGSGTIILGVAGATLYHFQIGYIIAFLLLGAMCGAGGAFAMESPFSTRKSRKR